MTKEETWAALVALGVVEGKSTQTGWYLHEANLRRANLSGADLHEADLTDATLIASVLIKADLTRANLSGACIDNADIFGWVIKDVTHSHRIGAKSGKQIKIGFKPLEFEKEK